MFCCFCVFITELLILCLVFVSHLQDYGTMVREFRIFFIKLPTGVVHTELVCVAMATT